MNKANSANLKLRLKEQLKRVDNLGFDTSSEAVTAIRDHDDFETRWDMSDQPDVLLLARDYKKALNEEIVSHIKGYPENYPISEIKWLLYDCGIYLNEEAILRVRTS